jgi:hypothetical protein
MRRTTWRTLGALFGATAISGGAACLFPSVGGLTGDAAIAPDAQGADASDAGAGEAGNNACPDAAFFCDDFETCDGRKWSGKEDNVPSQVIIDDAGPWRGACELHAITAYSDASIGGAHYILPLTPATSGTMAIRAYINLPKPLSTVTETSLFWLNADGADGGFDGELIFSVDTSGVWSIGTYGGAFGSGSTNTSQVAAPIGHYACVEWDFRLGLNGHNRVFVDNNPLPVIDDDMNTAGPLARGYDFLYVGFVNAQGPKAQEGFFDDVAVAFYPNDVTPLTTPRLGCE